MGTVRDFRASTYTEAGGTFGAAIADNDFESWWDSGGWTAGFENTWGIHNLKSDLSNVKNYLKRVCEVQDISAKALQDIMNAVQEVELSYSTKTAAENGALGIYLQMVKAFTSEMGENFPSSVDFSALQNKLQDLSLDFEKQSEFHYQEDQQAIQDEMNLMRSTDENGNWTSINWNYVQELMEGDPCELTDAQYSALYLLFIEMKPTIGDGAKLDENLQKYLNSATMIVPTYATKWDQSVEPPFYYSFSLEKSPVFERMYQMFKGTDQMLIQLALNPELAKNIEALDEIKTRLTHMALMDEYNNTIGIDIDGQKMPYFTLTREQSYKVMEQCRNWRVQNPGKNVPFSALESICSGQPVLIEMDDEKDTSGLGNPITAPYLGSFKMWTAKEFNPLVAFDPTEKNNKTGFWYGSPGTEKIVFQPLAGPNMVMDKVLFTNETLIEPLKPEVFDSYQSAAMNGAATFVLKEITGKVTGLPEKLIGKIPLVGAGLAFLYKAGKAGVEGISKNEKNKETLSFINDLNYLDQVVLNAQLTGGIVQYSMVDGKIQFEGYTINDRELWLRVQALNVNEGKQQNYTVKEVKEALFCENPTKEQKQLQTDFYAVNRTSKQKMDIEEKLEDLFKTDYEAKNGTDDGWAEIFRNLSPEGLQKVMDGME